jgi:hypothetical protein
VALTFATSPDHQAVADVHGEAQENVTVTVTDPDDVLATLYTDRTKSDETPNPTTTTSTGELVLWGEKTGLHTVVIAITGQDDQIRKLIFRADPEDSADVDDLALLVPFAEVANVVTASGTAQTLPEPTVASVNDVKLTGNCTFTFPAAAAAGKAKSFTLVLRQDATGGRTVTWPAGTKWNGGVAPTITATANGRDTYAFLNVNAGSWVGYVLGQDEK